MKFFKRLSGGFLICVLLLTTIGVFGAAASGGNEKIKYNRYNIVIVTDASGSMLSTDKDGLRYEAIGQFIATLAERGNHLGAVVFDTDVLLKQDLGKADGKAFKDDVISKIQSIKPYQGYTNIGKALETAVDMLDRGKDPELPSIILFLSDGKTEFAKDKNESDAMKVSLNQKAEAIESARNAGYKIYTISLNVDGGADSKELEQIAKATGGQFTEVKEAKDLEDVFKMYYSLIFSSKIDDGDVKTFPKSGEITDTFEILPIGVEEVNIILSGKATDYSFVDPSGNIYTKKEIESSTYSSDTFTVIKFVDPAPGGWTYFVNGFSGDKIRINIVYNSSLEIFIKADPQKDMYMVNDQIKITAWLTDAETELQKEQYAGFTARLSVDDGKGGANSYDMTLGSNGFEYVLAPDKSGTYTVRANIIGNEYDLFTENIKLNIDNTPPVKDKDLEETVLLWPFSDNKKTIDLKPAASDAQGPIARYEVESAAFMDSEYELQGTDLIMTGYSLTKGSVTIRAYDSDGAYCTFNVVIETVNMTVVGILLLVGGIVIVAAVAGIVLWINLNKRYMGSCYVTQFDDLGTYYEEKKREKGRGRIPLTAFNVKGTGLNESKCYFQATGKNYVYFCSKDKVCGDGKNDKKFQIDGGGFEVTIRANDSEPRGIRVKFVSRLNNTNNVF